MSIPPIPHHQTAQFDQFAIFFQQLRDALNLYPLEEILKRSLIDYGNTGHHLCFINADDPRPPGQEIVTGCVAQRLNNQGEIEYRYYAFYRDDRVEVRTDFSERTNLQVMHPWNAAISLIVGELGILEQHIADSFHRGAKQIESALYGDDDRQFMDSERPTAHAIPNPSSRPHT